jgi:dynein heavy chain
MKQTKSKPTVYSSCGVKAGTEKDPFGSQCSPQRLNDFIKWNKTMDKIQKNLEEYLEEKREEFPRFYFISNDELLQILANSADLKAIEKHANKCFENVSSFILQDELVRERQQEREAQKALQNSQEAANDSKKSTINHNSRKSPGNDINQRSKTNFKNVDNSIDVFSEHFDNSELNDIYGIKASQEEKVKFGRTVKTRGQEVEVWMKTLEEYMVQIMQKKIKDAYNKYYDDLAQGADRNSWVLHHLSQAVAVVDQLTWTESTEGALNDLLDDNPFAMEDHLTVMKEQLAQLTELIRGRLTSIQRMSLVALITQDVHCRDIVEQLLTKNVQTPFDFIWQQ